MKKPNKLDNRLTSQYIILLMSKTFITLFFVIFTFSNVFSLTLKEALDISLKINNPLLEQEYKKTAQLYRYKASLDPYYPSLDLSLGYSNYLDSKINPSIRDKGFYSGSLTLGYRVFDAKRNSQKNTQKYIYLIDVYNTDIFRNELIKLVKDYYYKALIDKEVLKIREETHNIAEKTYNLALAKYEIGIAKVSDVSQAKVNLENARLELINAQNSLLKSLSDLSSITGLNIAKDDITDSLTPFTIPIKEEEMKNIAFERRAELIKEVVQEKRLYEEKNLVISEFLPTISASVNYRRYDDKFFPSPSETTFALTLTYNIFSGPGKFYKNYAYNSEILAQNKRIAETKRLISLEITKALIDLNSGFEKLKIAEEIFNSAQKTYEQTFEEYRIGKGELINLLQAEANLASAKIQKINALYNLYIYKSSLEKSLGIRLIEELK